MYTVGLTHSEMRASPLGYEKQVRTLDEVYDHCLFIADQLGLELLLDRHILYEDFQKYDGDGVVFVTVDLHGVDLHGAEFSRQLTIILERSKKAEKGAQERLKLNTTTYTVGLAHDEVRVLPLSFEKHVSSLDEVYDHCAFIAQQVGLDLPLDRRSLCEGVQQQEEGGARFVTITFPQSTSGRDITIVFERSPKVRKRSKPKLRQRG
jgi:hypothetical protein